MIRIGLIIAALMGMVGCVYPGITLNKGYLLDPTMDPAKTGIMADSEPRNAYVKFERSAISGGGSSGSACPTCR
jgi:hypothetical protein